jgi:hypothetical protein
MKSTPAAARRFDPLGVGLALVAISGAVLLGERFIRPPDLAALGVLTDTLTAPIEVHHGSRDSAPYADLHVRQGIASINDICRLWDCSTGNGLSNAPPLLAGLKPGDRLELWLERPLRQSPGALGVVWQLAHGDEVLLSYAETMAAQRTDVTRINDAFAYPMLAGGLVSLIWGLIRKSRAARARHGS